VTSHPTTTAVINVGATAATMTETETGTETETETEAAAGNAAMGALVATATRVIVTPLPPRQRAKTRRALPRPMAISSFSKRSICLAAKAAAVAKIAAGGKTIRSTRAWYALYLNVGRRQNFRPEELTSFLQIEGELDASDIGRVDTKDRHSYVMVNKDVSEKLIGAVDGKSFRDREIRIEIAKPAHAAAGANTCGGLFSTCLCVLIPRRHLPQARRLAWGPHLNRWRLRRRRGRSGLSSVLTALSAEQPGWAC
jgi:hypothetical protein